MIEKIHSVIDLGFLEYVVHCDFCPHYKEYDEIYSWDDLTCAMEKDGWKSMKDKEEWKHACFTCIKKMMMGIQLVSLIEEENNE